MQMKPQQVYWWVPLVTLLHPTRIARYYFSSCRIPEIPFEITEAWFGCSRIRINPHVWDGLEWNLN
jgi:hypothetical protein